MQSPSNRSRLTAKVFEVIGKLELLPEVERRAAEPAKATYQELIQLWWNEDPFRCSKCGYRMELVRMWKYNKGWIYNIFEMSFGMDIGPPGELPSFLRAPDYYDYTNKKYGIEYLRKQFRYSILLAMETTANLVGKGRKFDEYCQKRKKLHAKKKIRAFEIAFLIHQDVSKYFKLLYEDYVSSNSIFSNKAKRAEELIAIKEDSQFFLSLYHKSDFLKVAAPWKGKLLNHYKKKKKAEKTGEKELGKIPRTYLQFRDSSSKIKEYIAHQWDIEKVNFKSDKLANRFKSVYMAYFNLN